MRKEVKKNAARKPVYMNKENLRIILTGATGMVGEGVLSVCLEHPAVEKVLVVSRRPCGKSHPKLTEVIHPDFFDLTPIRDQLVGYNACYFCAGVSAVGMKEEEYFRVTYTLTIGFARTITALNDNLTFCYVTGAGTDSSEKGRMMWARVKGKTENDLLKLKSRVFNFRPAFMKPRENAQYVPSFYKYVKWMYPVGKALYPQGFCTTDDVGLAMINVSLKGYPTPVLEVPDILKISREKP